MRAIREVRILPKVGQVRFLREEVRLALDSLQVEPAAVDRLVLAVDELASNAIEHGEDYRQPTDELVVRLGRLQSGELEIEFVDPSVPKATLEILQAMLNDSRAGNMPPLDSERGRGLFLIQGEFDEIEIEALPNGLGLLLRGHVDRGPRVPRADVSSS